jgi:hypothetical protein
MSETQYPDEYLCPISRQLMTNPVTIKHNNSYFTFEKNNIEIWKITKNGDNNPLTNMPNFRKAPGKLNENLKKEIKDFIETHNIEIEEDENDYTLNDIHEPNYNLNNIDNDLTNNLFNHNNLFNPNNLFNHDNLFNYVLDNNNLYDNNINFINNENQNIINQMNNIYNFNNNFTNNYLNQFETNTNHNNFINNIMNITNSNITYIQPNITNH